MSTSNGAWERAAIIFLAVFTVGVVTASFEDEPASLQSDSMGKIEPSPSGDVDG